MGQKLFILFLLILSIVFILFFGLREKVSPGVNQIQWLENEKGLYVDGNSFAYTKSFVENSIPYVGVTIEIVLKPHFYDKPRFSMILQIYDKTDDSQLTIGQWDRSLVVLNNNDFSNKRRLPKIYTSFCQTNEICLLTIRSDKTGTTIYQNGNQIKYNPDLILDYPQVSQDTNLMVGNSISGRNPWRGTLYDLAFYNQSLSKDSIEEHYQKWMNTGKLLFEKPLEPLLYYSFYKRTGSTVNNEMELSLPLMLPENFIILKKRILRMPDFSNIFSEAMKVDLLLNYFGFFPLGFLLFFFFTEKGLWKKKTILTTILTISFLLSLSIELLQVNMVMRDSSLLDLILNSSGGFSGGLLATRFRV